MKTLPAILKTFVRQSWFCFFYAVSLYAHPGHSDEPELIFAQNLDEVKSTNSAQPKVSITVEGDYRVIRSNGMPNHETGQFPNRHNPNRLAPQDYNFRVPLKPTIEAKTTSAAMHPFGVAVNGVVFDPGANEWWNDDRSTGWQYEPLFMNGKLGVDQSNAHVQPGGVYHYHAIPTGLLNKSGAQKMVLLGWAADGFPIYGPWCYSEAKNTNSALKKMKSNYRVKKGMRPDGPGGNYDGKFVGDWEFVKGEGDLDECNGRSGVTPEFPKGTYYYVLTEDFPFIPRLYRGTPDSSFFRKGPPPGRRRGPRPERQAFLSPGRD